MRNYLQRGFTLIEMIVVIVITGIIAGIVAIFIQAPVKGYVDSARRAELTDIADTAVRRMARDVRSAVPNSTRMDLCTAPCVEFIPTKDGGRYRADTPGNTLEFNTATGTVVADTTFEIVGGAIDFVAGDFIVVGSTQSDGTLPYLDTVAGVRRAYSAYAHPLVTIVNAVGLPYTSKLSSQRFDVVDGTQQAVTYACEGVGTDAAGNGTGQLVRHWNYGFDHAWGGGDSSAVLADKVSACAITYAPANQRFGLLSVSLTLKSENESVSLYNEIHVNNAP